MSPSVVVPETSAPGRLSLLHNLILVRLVVPGKKPPPESKVRADVNRVAGNALSADDFAAALEQFRAEKLVDDKNMVLTAAGREAVLAFLRVKQLPARCDWRVLCAKFLVPLALGLDPDSTAARKIAKEDHLGAVLLRRKEKLPDTTGHTLNAALEALACKKLGFPKETRLKNVRDLVLARMLESETPLARKQLVKQLPRVLLDTPRGGMEGLREAALRDWLAAPQQPQSARPGMDLPEFAHTVLALARTCETGRFGDNKVFINHIWRALRQEPHLPPCDLGTFKARLVEANHQGLLTLSRADLVAVMNADDVRESETHYLNAAYHFVLIEKERP